MSECMLSDNGSEFRRGLTETLATLDAQQTGIRAGRPCASGEAEPYSSAGAALGGAERTRTARTVDGHHWRPPCAVGTC